MNTKPTLIWTSFRLRTCQNNVQIETKTKEDVKEKYFENKKLKSSEKQVENEGGIVQSKCRPGKEEKEGKPNINVVTP